MNIRKSKKEDLKDLVKLLNQLSPSKEADFNKLKIILDKILKDENYYLCVFEENNSLIGTGLLLIQLNLSHSGQPYGHIENIVVDSSHRGKGIGREIVCHLIEKAKEKGCYKVILDCKKENTPFYSKCSMFETGEVEMRANL